MRFSRDSSGRQTRGYLALAPIAVLALAACKAEPANDQTEGTAPRSEANADASPSAAASQARDGSIHEKDGEIEFTYTWPSVAESIPELSAWLNKNGERLKADTLKGGQQEKASSEKNAYPFRGYTYEEHWAAVADVPQLLVMQSEGYTFTGGAHGMPIVTTLIWDKARKQRLALGDLMNVSDATTALRSRFCKALDDERAKRRGAPVDSNDPGPVPGFVECVDIAKQTILPVSLNGKALDTIRVVIMPYEAGPYAEGIYQLDLPVDAAVLKTVKPAYKGAFAGG